MKIKKYIAKVKKINSIKIIIPMTFLFVFCNFAVISNAQYNRISGNNRYSTAVEISKKLENSQNIIITSGSNYIDALSATVLANATNSRILLVDNGKIDKKTLAEIERVSPEKIYILGGEKSVPKEIESVLSNKYNNIDRISGRNRYETSMKIAEKISEIVEIKEVAVASNEADLISASSYCKGNIPIILIDSKNPNTDYINSRKEVKKTVFGGEKSVNADTYKKIGASSRISGNNRYTTAIEVAKLNPENTKAYVASGENIIDALTLGPLANQDNANIILSRKIGLSKETIPYVENRYKENITIVGGNNSVPDDVFRKIKPQPVPTDRSSFEYWDYYNHYKKDVIMSKEEIKNKNKQNISASRYLYTVENIKGEYGVVSKRVVMKAKPISGKNPDSFDDYSAVTGLFPWDELAIVGYNADKSWAHVFTTDYEGWIPTNSIMKLSREKMLEIREQEFITYINRQTKTNTGDVIDMGTYLPLKGEDSNSYKVFIPIAGNNYRSKTVDIPKNQAVKGYLEFTEANVIKQVLKFQGEKYGWGHSNMTRDCSGLVRDVYRSFGIVMARDASSQQSDIIGKKTDFRNAKSQKAKEDLLLRQRPGNCFYLPGHVFMYLGKDQNNRPMIIHQYGHTYINGNKVNKFKTEITDSNQKSTPSNSFLYYVSTGVNFYE
ncbi:MAG: cell wall-binding repeat-containing protein [Peptostreptococcus sp.]|uniref:cell wall-binding repeat-containing protein n=1 Tax=Peptostreptococcus sp. TaxID=1262 RepID=UPI002FCA05BB